MLNKIYMLPPELVKRKLSLYLSETFFDSLDLLSEQLTEQLLSSKGDKPIKISLDFMVSKETVGRIFEVISKL